MSGGTLEMERPAKCFMHKRVLFLVLVPGLLLYAYVWSSYIHTTTMDRQPPARAVALFDRCSVTHDLVRQRHTIAMAPFK